MGKAIILAAALFVASCVDKDATRATLEKAGFSDVETGNYAPFSCGKEDIFATKFAAKNPQGIRVEGVVCCGALKSCTVRF